VGTVFLKGGDAPGPYDLLGQKGFGGGKFKTKIKDCDKEAGNNFL